MSRRISIAMATYNGSQFVQEQLNSLTEQSLPPFEIVICDDDSTDGTREIIESYARGSAVPIRCVHNQNRLGWRENFIKASSLCTGDLIGFCDQDDFWHPAKLERMARCFDNPDVVMAFHDFRLVDKDLHLLQPYSSESRRMVSIPGKIDAWSDILGFTIVFDKKLLGYWPLWCQSIDKHHSDLSAPHDQWVIFLASMLGTITYVDEQLVDYRQHEKNAVGIGGVSKTRRRLRLPRNHVSFLNSRLSAIENRLSIIDKAIKLDTQTEGILGPFSDRYLSYRKCLMKQRQLYCSGRLTDRVLIFGDLLFEGSYAGEPWHLSRRALLRDFTVALFGAGNSARMMAREECENAPAFTIPQSGD